ncbi:MAG: nuclear transport factor 2 family protein [Chloroflexota bacterium]
MPETREELLRVAEAWAAAELKGDIGHMAGSLTNDFTAVGPRGFLLSKDQWLDRHRSGALQYSSFALSETNLRVYDQTAVIIGRQAQAGEYQGRDIQGEFRATLVLVREAGRWLLASLHLSPIIAV